MARHSKAKVAFCGCLLLNQGNTVLFSVDNHIRYVFRYIEESLVGCGRFVGRKDPSQIQYFSDTSCEQHMSFRSDCSAGAEKVGLFTLQNGT